MTKISLICAMDSNHLIGDNNALPWHLPADLAFFKRTTMGKPILMGRKTYESIGKPLPGRQNIVMTGDALFSAEGCDIADNLDQALDLAAEAEEVMIIGGASLYQQTIDRANNLYITQIHHVFQGDTWFPEFNQLDWVVESREDFDADLKNPYPYSFIKFVQNFLMDSGRLDHP